MPSQTQREPKFDVMPKEDLKLPPLLQPVQKEGSSSLEPRKPEGEKIKELLANILS